MNNKKFLRDYPLTVRIPAERIALFKKALIIANESFPLRMINEQPEADSTIFYIVCETKYYAEAYYHFGKLTAQAFHGQITNPFNKQQ